MQIIYRLQDRDFEWDTEKTASNLVKHGVSLEEAAEVFFDPFQRSGDADRDEQEVRDYIIGYTFGSRLLLAVYTERTPRTRIISARPVTRTERKRYEEG